MSDYVQKQITTALTSSPEKVPNHQHVDKSFENHALIINIEEPTKELNNNDVSPTKCGSVISSDVTSGHPQITNDDSMEQAANEKFTLNCVICGKWKLKDFLGVITAGLVGGLLLYLLLHAFRPPSLRGEQKPKMLNPETEDESAEYYNLKKSGMTKRNNLGIGENTVYISSHLDLRGIIRTDLTVKVLSLTNRTPPSGISPISRQGIKHLELLGPISQAWLYYLIGSLNSIESIVINVDEVCSGFDKIDSSSAADADESSMIVLPKLLNIKAENSYNCPILKWGFEVETPKLQTVEIKKASLRRSYYDILSTILTKTSNTIEGIEISESYICVECDITELQFDNLKYLKITKRVDQAPYGDQ